MLKFNFFPGLLLILYYILIAIYKIIALKTSARQ